MAVIDAPSSQELFHGTKADLKPGDLIEAGRSSTRRRHADLASALAARPPCYKRAVNERTRAPQS